jgi:TonB family protein
MYNRLSHVLLLCCLAISTAAISQEIADPSSKTATEGEQAHKLPKVKTFPSRFDFYPEEGKRRNLEGRVLVEFGLDRNGKPTSVTIVQADAPPVLQAGALKLMQNITYDMTAPNFDAADARPFRLTIKFCLPDCTRFATFPGSEDMTVRGSPLPPGFRR